MEKELGNIESATRVFSKMITEAEKRDQNKCFQAGYGNLAGVRESQNQILVKDSKNKEKIISADKIVIATGSVPVSLPGIDFDEKIITYEKIIKIFFQIHDPTTLNSQGPDFGTQYRSEIFYLNDQQKGTAEKVLQDVNERLSGKVVTKISLLKNYCPAEEYHQKYLEKK